MLRPRRRRSIAAMNTSPPSRRALLVVVGVLAFGGLFSASFVLSGHDPQPHGMDVAVAGPPAAAQALAERIEREHGAAYDVRTYATAAQARGAIDDRDAYGAVVLGADGAAERVLVASGGSAAAAREVEHALTAAAGTATVEDVRPLASGDPRGVGLSLMLLPLVVASLLVATALSEAVPDLTAGRRIGALAGFAALAGLGAAGLAHAVDVMPGSYLGLAAVLAFTVLAIASVTAALEASPLGLRGLGVGILTFMVVGNPASGAASAPELLPGFWRVAGQLLPPGAGASAARDVAYFGGAALTRPLLVLGAFAALGLGGIVLTHRSRAEAGVHGAHARLEPIPAT